MVAKSYNLDCEPGEESVQKSVVGGSPCHTPVKILDQFSPDSSGNLLIECRRMQMKLNKQKGEINRLKQEQKTKSFELDTTTNLRNEISSLRAQLQSERASSNSQIMELEDKVVDLLASNRQLRAEIARTESPESSINAPPEPPRRSVLPSRWTRSQPNLKEPANTKIISPAFTISDDSIDLLGSRVSELAVETPIPVTRHPQILPSDIIQTKSFMEPKLNTKRSLYMLKEPPVQLQPSSLVAKVLGASPIDSIQAGSPSKQTPRKSRFIENFSLDNSSKSLDNSDSKSIPNNSSSPTIDFPVKNPTPTFESTFIGDSLQRIPETPTKGRFNIPKTAKSFPNIKLVMSSQQKKSSLIPMHSKTIFEMVSQVFLGEMLYKTTKGFYKTEQHPRFFWVHPYTLTLYWGKESPSSGKGNPQPKSLPILGVSEEVNPNQEAGLFHKSIIVLTGKRSLKLTCSDSNQHDIWIRSFRHLLAGAKKNSN